MRSAKPACTSGNALRFAALNSGCGSKVGQWPMAASKRLK